MSEFDEKIKELVTKVKLSKEEQQKLLEQHLKKQREDEAKRQEMIKLIMETQNHNRRTCDCDGCKYWWQSNTLMENGVFFEILPNIKELIKKKGIALYLQKFIICLKRQTLVGGESLWVAYDASLERRMVQTEI